MPFRPLRRRCCWRGVTVGVLAGVLIAAGGGQAGARRGVRPLFEPTDLDLEDTGVLELDVQLGAIRSAEGPARVVVPDFEVNLGLLPNLEIDVDGAYAVEGTPEAPFAFQHAAPDTLWVGAKVGLLDYGGDDSEDLMAAGAPGADAWSLGVQAGPKLPVLAGTRGVGAEVLALVGYTAGPSHFVLNAGGFVDPHPDPASGRPSGFEGGLDVARALGGGGRWAASGELAGVHFVSRDPDQLVATAGLVWSPSESLDLSLTGLAGFLRGGDRYGVLLGFSPKLRLFGGGSK